MSHSNKTYYSFNKSMKGFLQEVMHEPVYEEDIELSFCGLGIIVSRLGTLIRMTDYLEYQIQYCKSKKYLDLDSVIPVPRECNGLFIDIIHSTTSL